ncbi:MULTISPECIES: hypothetical protein [Paenibacillus]|uniref:hypothetical protein n=1 Tax=Paenibacillus TaxID=44249 RepID=UPI0011410568|nr:MULTISPECIES: hypothetical protein [Paenibacillus]
MPGKALQRPARVIGPWHNHACADTRLAPTAARDGCALTGAAQIKTRGNNHMDSCPSGSLSIPAAP